MNTLNEMFKAEDIAGASVLNSPLPTLLFENEYDQGFAIRIRHDNLDKVIEICEKLKLAARNKNLPLIDYSYAVIPRKSVGFTRDKECVFRVGLPVCNLGPYRVICRMDFKNSLDANAIYEKQGEQIKFTPFIYTKKGFPVEAIPESILNGTCPPNCDHCKVNRARNETYLIFNTQDQSFKQVGSTCVDQYTGIENASAYLKYFALIENLQFAVGDYEEKYDYDRDKEGLSKFGDWVPLNDVIAITQAVINKDGKYFSKESASYEGATPTADTVKSIIQGFARLPDCDYDQCLKNSPSIIQSVTSACKTMKNREYAHNLSLSLQHDLVAVNKLGLACSAVAVWFRNVVVEKEKMVRAERAFVAGVSSTEKNLQAGDKIEKNLRITKMKDSDMGRFPSTLVIMVDENNLEYKWSASSPPRNFDPDTHYTAKMTIKGFDEYQGVPQRQVTRVSFPELDAVKVISTILHSTAYSKTQLYKELAKINDFTMKVRTNNGVSQSWINSELFDNCSSQAIYDFLTHPKVMNEWKAISANYTVRGDKFARPSIHSLLFSKIAQSEVYLAKTSGSFVDINGESASVSFRKLAHEMHESGVFYLNKFNADEKSIVEKIHVNALINEVLGERGADSSYLAYQGTTDEVQSAYKSLHAIFQEIGKSVVLPSILLKDFSGLQEPIIGVGQSTNRLFVYDKSYNQRLLEDSNNRFKVPAVYDSTGEPYFAISPYIKSISYDRLQSVADAATQHGYPNDYLPGFQLERHLKAKEENNVVAKTGGLSIG